VNTPVVAAASTRVVKTRSVAHSCKKILVGSGFVVAPNRVLTNAHSVAGSDQTTVQIGDGPSYDARVVMDDPDMDVAVLYVPDLTAQPLQFADEPAAGGTDALILGFTGGGPLSAKSARIREEIKLNGPDIYHDKNVTREVYAIRGVVRQGDSGGPLIDVNGRVLGIIFGASSDDPETGFAMTASQVLPALANAAKLEPVPTGVCVH
jgi:S1-C subfamily serine protease